MIFCALISKQEDFCTKTFFSPHHQPLRFPKFLIFNLLFLISFLHTFSRIADFRRITPYLFRHTYRVRTKTASSFAGWIIYRAKKAQKHIHRRGTRWRNILLIHTIKIFIIYPRNLFHNSSRHHQLPGGIVPASCLLLHTRGLSGAHAEAWGGISPEACAPVMTKQEGRRPFCFCPFSSSSLSQVVDVDLFDSAGKTCFVFICVRNRCHDRRHILREQREEDGWGKKRQNLQDTKNDISNQIFCYLIL